MKVLLDLSSYATKKELKDATCVDTFKSDAKKDFIVLNAEVDKLDLGKLINVLSGLKNLKNKGDDSVVKKLKDLDLLSLRIRRI